MSFTTANRNYRKPITVSTASANQANFQKNITVTYVSGKMASDFSDLIFQDNSGNNLPYWIESKTDGTSASVWVLITTSSSSTSTIYMYYGTGETITSPSNIDNVMDTGLRFFYYTGMAFNTYVGTGIDTTPNYNWSSGAVTINGVGGYSDNLSIYWIGWIKPDGLGTTVMYCASDDGQRMYINNSLVIDNWVDQGETERSYSFNMQSIVSIRYNYYENGGGAIARIGWDSVNSSKVYPIPSTYLRCHKYLPTEPTMTFGEEEYAASINTLKVPRRDRFPGAI